MKINSHLHLNDKTTQTINLATYLFYGNHAANSFYSLND